MWFRCALLVSICAVLPLFQAFAQPGLRGRVTDGSGAAVANAVLEVRNAAGSPVSISRSDPEGGYTLPHLPVGTYHLLVSAEGFSPRELAVTLRHNAPLPTITLEPHAVFTHVTVSAVRGTVDDERSSPYVARIVDGESLARGPLPTIGNALAAQPGILVQQSTYAQVSPFLRGLTGYQVLNLVDGIRFNNSTFRSGPNQYLAFVEPFQAQRVEALLGPTGAQYGSDALGGAINVVTPEARFSSSPVWETHGSVLLAGASADLSGAGTARLSAGTDRVSLMLAASGRRHNDLRPGGGADSRNVFARLFGMPADEVQALAGPRLQDTGFRQYGLETKLAARLARNQHVSVYYQRGVQDQVRAYKDLLGGLGRLQSAFDPQILNWFHARYEKLGLGFVDSLTGTFSVNSQADGSLRQNLRASDPVTRDWSRVNAYGYSLQATTHWRDRVLAAFGGDIYDERIASTRELAAAGGSAPQAARPLYPDGSTYRTFALFGQSSAELTRRLSAQVGGRLTGVHFRAQPDSRFQIPGSSQWFRDVTFNTSLRWQAAPFFGLHALVSRGFRAPNLSDLGAIGLNDLGYEIPAAAALSSGALLSTDAGESALSKSIPLAGLRSESLLNYEAGVRFTTRRLYGRVQAFDAELSDPIVRRTLLFPAGSAPRELAGLPVTPLPPTAAQQKQGVVAVATGVDPRAVKAFVNDGRSRYYGIESLLQFALSHRWSLGANYSFLVGRDLDPNRPARRLPPQAGAATLRYVPAGRRPWFEVSLAASGGQGRLSGGDLDDERIGASRRRRDIADFFRGSRVEPLVDASGVFVPTGETLRRIQDRVLPLGAIVNGMRIVDDNTRVPLYLATAGWATLNVRAGMPLGERWSLLLALDNLLDRNYRVHGSGVDAPGINGYAGIRFLF